MSSNTHKHNPFSEDNQASSMAVQDTARRFPDISEPSVPQQGQQGQFFPQQQPQQPLTYNPTGAPTAFYGQQQHIPQQQPMQQQQTAVYSGAMAPNPTGFGYQPNQYYQQQQQQPPRPQVADLDPYGQLGGMSSGMHAPHANSSQTALIERLLSSSSTGRQVDHPKTYVGVAHDLLSTWDANAWKELMSKIDLLRGVWESRKDDIEAASREGGDPTLVEKLKRDALSNIDSIHAAKMQLSEAQDGWRVSTDVVSKARVREALNAGISSLPEYPPALSPESFGGSLGRFATEMIRNNGIMSMFNTPQQSQPQAQQYGQYNQQQYGQPAQPQSQFGQQQFGAMNPAMTGVNNAFPQQGFGQQQTGQQPAFGQQGGFMASNPTGYAQQPSFGMPQQQTQQPQQGYVPNNGQYMQNQSTGFYNNNNRYF